MSMRGPLRHLLLTLRTQLSQRPRGLAWCMDISSRSFPHRLRGHRQNHARPSWHRPGGAAHHHHPRRRVLRHADGHGRRSRARTLAALPASAGGIGSVSLSACVIARFILVASAAAMQIGLAKLIYRMPMPDHPWQLCIAFSLTALAFLGVGLVIAMLAGSVPAVQAMGQCIFLPMIIIGGIGVPLSLLPAWARRVSQFLPGRYAAEAMQTCVSGAGLSHYRFDLVALLLFRSRRIPRGEQDTFRWDAGRCASSACAYALGRPRPCSPGQRSGIAAGARGRVLWPGSPPRSPPRPPGRQLAIAHPRRHRRDPIRRPGTRFEARSPPFAPDLKNLCRPRQNSPTCRTNWPPGRPPTIPIPSSVSATSSASPASSISPKDADEAVVPLIVLQRMQSEYSQARCGEDPDLDHHASGRRFLSHGSAGIGMEGTPLTPSG